MIGRRQILIALGASALAVTLPALAQQPARPRRIGFSGGGIAQTNARWLAAFRGGMAELRWVEGRDYVLEARSGDAEQKAMAERAAALAAWQPEVMLLVGEVGIPAVAKAMKSVPIVLTGSTDPVGLGFAASLRRPGGNVTGLTDLSIELGAKRLELLKEAFPRISHVAVLADAGDAISVQVKTIEDAAARLKLRFTAIRFRQAAEIEPAFKRAAALGVDAYIQTAGPSTTIHGILIVNS